MVCIRPMYFKHLGSTLFFFSRSFTHFPPPLSPLSAPFLFPLQTHLTFISDERVFQLFSVTAICCCLAVFPSLQRVRHNIFLFAVPALLLPSHSAIMQIIINGIPSSSHHCLPSCICGAYCVRLAFIIVTHIIAKEARVFAVNPI